MHQIELLQSIKCHLSVEMFCVLYHSRLKKVLTLNILRVGMRFVKMQRLKHGICECKTITISCCVINWGETDAGKNNIFKTLGKTITCFCSETAQKHYQKQVTLSWIMQDLSVPFACVGSGDRVRVLRLYTMNTLDTL